MRTSVKEQPGTPWQRFARIRHEKGIVMRRIEQDSGLRRMNIWGMLHRLYGYPDTPEKRQALLRALNAGPGDPVAEADIWPGEDDAAPDGAAAS